MRLRQLVFPEANRTNTYNGRHRIYEMSHGVGHFPHGDRNRGLVEYGYAAVEERDSDPNIRRI